MNGARRKLKSNRIVIIYPKSPVCTVWNSVLDPDCRSRRSVCGSVGRGTRMFLALCVFSACPASSLLSSVYAGALWIWRGTVGYPAPPPPPLSLDICGKYTRWLDESTSSVFIRAPAKERWCIHQRCHVNTKWSAFIYFHIQANVIIVTPESVFWKHTF